MTTLPEQHANVANVHLSATEHNQKIIFLHSVKDGPASQSYGLQVASLAGVPREVIEEAQNKLKTLENQNVHQQEQQTEQWQLPLFAEPEDPVIERLKNLDLNDLTPKQALLTLYDLQEKLNN